MAVDQAVFDALMAPRPYYNEFFRAWVIADPSHIRSLDRSSRVSAARSQSFRARLPPEVLGRVPLLEQFRERMLMFMDGDEHVQLRIKIAGLLKRRLPKVRAGIVAQWLQAWDAAEGCSEFNAVDLVLAPAITEVMRILTNCPQGPFDAMLEWSRAFNRSMSGSAVASDFLSAEQAFMDVWQLLDGCEHDDWIDQLFDGSSPAFSRDEMKSTVLLLLFAGSDSSLSMVSNVMNLLIGTEPPPSGIDLPTNYLAELAGRVVPVKFTMREVVEAFQFEGCDFSTRDRLLFSWLGADALACEAGKRENFAFGVGLHSCLGKTVALCQLEGCIAGWRNIEVGVARSGPTVFNTNACFYYPKSIPCRSERRVA